MLEVVLSTDGVEPLYFITADDLTYQAKCPIVSTQKQSNTEDIITSVKNSELKKNPAGYQNNNGYFFEK